MGGCPCLCTDIPVLKHETATTPASFASDALSNSLTVVKVCKQASSDVLSYRQAREPTQNKIACPLLLFGFGSGWSVGCLVWFRKTHTFTHSSHTPHTHIHADDAAHPGDGRHPGPARAGAHRPALCQRPPGKTFWWCVIGYHPRSPPPPWGVLLLLLWMMYRSTRTHHHPPPPKPLTTDPNTKHKLKQTHATQGHDLRHRLEVPRRLHLPRAVPRDADGRLFPLPLPLPLFPAPLPPALLLVPHPRHRRHALGPLRGNTIEIHAYIYREEEPRAIK